jgi:cytochrome bd-type quinol oxidase subunit 2
MGYIKRKRKRLPAWKRVWKRRYTISPVVGILIGVVLGCALATISALTPPRDFSYRFFALLLLILGPCGGIFAYFLWLIGNPVRGERFQRIMSSVSFLVVPGLLVAVPYFWWHTGRSRGSFFVSIALGAACCSMVMCVVAAGWVLFHLVHQLASSIRHYASSLRESSKPVAGFRKDGVWDRELDEG